MDKKIKAKTTVRHNFVYSDEHEDWIEGEHYITHEQCFNEAGHLLSEKSYNRDGELGEHNEFRYNEQGQLVEECIYFEGNELAEQHVFQYREDGKVEEEKIVYQESYADRVHFTYDGSGHLTERRQEDEDGETESCETYVYEGDLLMQETSLGADAELLSEVRYEYDEQGRLVASYHKGREDHEEYRMVYEYDEQGNRDCVERYDRNGKIAARTTMHHDEKGNVVESFEEDTVSSKTLRFQYDEKGNNVLQEEYNDKEELNHRIERMYTDEGELAESVVYIDRHDQGPDQYYSIKVEVEYY